MILTTLLLVVIVGGLLVFIEDRQIRKEIAELHKEDA